MEKKSTNGWGKKLETIFRKGKENSEPTPTVSLNFLHSACVGCSLCSLSCQAILDGTAPSWFEPKQRFVTLSDVSSPCRSCRECSSHCPIGVALHP